MWRLTKKLELFLRDPWPGFLLLSILKSVGIVLMSLW